MIDEQHKQTLKLAFTALTPKQIENFRWHLQHETPVLCGKPACELPYFNGGIG